MISIESLNKYTCLRCTRTRTRRDLVYQDDPSAARTCACVSGSLQAGAIAPHASAGQVVHPSPESHTHRRWHAKTCSCPPTHPLTYGHGRAPSRTHTCLSRVSIGCSHMCLCQREPSPLTPQQVRWSIHHPKAIHIGGGTQRRAHARPPILLHMGMGGHQAARTHACPHTSTHNLASAHPLPCNAGPHIQHHTTCSLRPNFLCSHRIPGE